MAKRAQHVAVCCVMFDRLHGTYNAIDNSLYFRRIVIQNFVEVINCEDCLKKENRALIQEKNQVLAIACVTER